MIHKLRLADRTNDIFPILGFVAALASFAMPLNPLLVAVILAGAVVAAVHHAEVIAHRVGEPFGTLILALAVTVIEVGLILTLMQAEPEKAQTLARDTVFAAVMVILNLLMGLCLLVGSLRHHEQRFQRTGIGAALATLTVLTIVTLVLPNFTLSVPGPFYSANQLGFVAAVSLILYATFALVQTVRHRDYFLPEGEAHDEPDAHAAPPSVQRTAISGALLLASLFAVVLLAKTLSPVIGALLADLGGAARRAGRADRGADPRTGRAGGGPRRQGRPLADQPQPRAGIGAGDDRPDHPGRGDPVDHHRPADQPWPRRQVDRALVPVADRRVADAGERAHHGASGDDPPDAVRGLSVHDFRTLNGDRDHG